MTTVLSFGIMESSRVAALEGDTAEGCGLADEERRNYVQQPVLLNGRLYGADLFAGDYPYCFRDIQRHTAGEGERV